MIFCFLLVSCFGRCNWWMWMASGRKQLMVTQVPAPDSLCKLNISWFLTLPHPLNCLIYNKDIIIIVLFLKIKEDWKDRTYITIKLLGHVYHFWLVTCYPYSFCSMFQYWWYFRSESPAWWHWERLETNHRCCYCPEFLTWKRVWLCLICGCYFSIYNPNQDWLGLIYRCYFSTYNPSQEDWLNWLFLRSLFWYASDHGTWEIWWSPFKFGTIW